MKEVVETIMSHFEKLNADQQVEVFMAVKNNLLDIRKGMADELNPPLKIGQKQPLIFTKEMVLL